MSGGKKGRGCEAPVEDQEAFIRGNAVALVRERDEKIARLRRRVTELEQRARCRDIENARLRAALRSCAEHLRSFSGQTIASRSVLGALETADNLLGERTDHGQE